MTAINSHVWDPDLIHVVLIGGLGGSGKSTLGDELGRRTGFPVFDKDEANPLSEAALMAMGIDPNDRESIEYRTRVRDNEYRSMMNNVLRNVSIGNSAIAVAPFGKEFGDSAWRAEFEESCRTNAKSRRVAVHYVSAYVNDDVLKRRLTSRNEPRDTAKLNDWDQWIKEARQAKPIEPCYEIDCSTDGEAAATACALKIIEAFHLMPPAFPARPGFFPLSAPAAA